LSADLYLDTMRPGDEPAIAALAAKNGTSGWVSMEKGSVIVVRSEYDMEAIIGICVLRECYHGFVIDDIWSDGTVAGIKAISMLFCWCEQQVADIATSRRMPVHLGGVVRIDNPKAARALENRGYAPLANVWAKTFLPEIKRVGTEEN